MLKLEEQLGKGVCQSLGGFQKILNVHSFEVPIQLHHYSFSNLFDVHNANDFDLDLK